MLQMAQCSSKGMSDFSDDSSKKDRQACFSPTTTFLVDSMCVQCMLGPFDVIWPLFSKEEVSKTAIDKRIDYFFVDYSMVPMIVQAPPSYLAASR